MQSADVRPLGQEPQTQAMIYDLMNPSYSLNIAGTGTIGQSNGSSTDDDADRPQVDQKNPPVYQHLGLLIGLALATLATGVLLLYRSSPVRDAGR